MGHRHFEDASGNAWHVWTVDMATLQTSADSRPPETSTRSAMESAIGGRFGAPWLAFSSKSERRRLRPVPDNWIAMSDASLRDLLTRAEVVRERSSDFVTQD